ncbi:MAG: hypothetical protein AB7S77_19930, partial [Desulfatirhabdiaceae bacterium]
FNKIMMTAMHESGIDMEFRSPAGLDVSEFSRQPDRVVVLGQDIGGMPSEWNSLVEVWQVPKVDEANAGQIQMLRNDIEARVNDLIRRL